MRIPQWWRSLLILKLIHYIETYLQDRWICSCNIPWIYYRREPCWQLTKIDLNLTMGDVKWLWRVQSKRDMLLAVTFVSNAIKSSAVDAYVFENRMWLKKKQIMKKSLRLEINKNPYNLRFEYACGLLVKACFCHLNREWSREKRTYQ